MQNYHGIAAVRRMAQPGALPYGAKTVFAGGTCLALGHRLVERYSEDIDMVIVGCADLGADQRDEVLESLADLVSDRGRFPAARGGEVEVVGVAERRVRVHARDDMGLGVRWPRTAAPAAQVQSAAASAPTGPRIG